MPTITGIAHLELSVRDLDASEAWYGKVFGMVRVFEGKGDKYGIHDRALMEPNTRLILALTHHYANAGEPFDAVRTGLDHVSFAVNDPQNLAAWREHLTALGELPSPVIDWGSGASSFTVADPDGIAVEFFSMLPRE